MKILIFLVAGLLAACASGPTPGQLAAQAYVDANRPLAIAGTLKWSTYYLGLYEKQQSGGAPSFVLSTTNNLEATARRYEAGQISKKDFESARRGAQAEVAGHYENLATQQRVEQQNRQMLAAQQLAASAAMLNASKPQPVYQTPQPYQPPGNAYVTGFLRSQSVNGTMKYCNYSNGAVITLAAYQLCPMSTN